jgi:hypothetical protein
MKNQLKCINIHVQDNLYPNGFLRLNYKYYSRTLGYTNVIDAWHGIWRDEQSIGRRLSNDS